MKKFFAFLFCAATLAGFAGCSDDDEERVDAALLSGVWRQTAEYDGWDDTWEYDDFERYPHYMVLNADGTGAKGLSSPTAAPSPYSQFVWRCEGRRFIFRYTDEQEERVWDIEKLTQEELVFSVECEDEGDRWVEKESYIRVQ